MRWLDLSNDQDTDTVYIPMYVMDRLTVICSQEARTETRYAALQLENTYMFQV